MGRLLAVDRMSNAQLWSVTGQLLSQLSSSYVGEYTIVERRGMAKRALECVDELHLRGVQLTMDQSADSR